MYTLVQSSKSQTGETANWNNIWTKAILLKKNIQVSVIQLVAIGC